MLMVKLERPSGAMSSASSRCWCSLFFKVQLTFRACETMNISETHAFVSCVWRLSFRGNVCALMKLFLCLCCIRARNTKLQISRVPSTYRSAALKKRQNTDLIKVSSKDFISYLWRHTVFLRNILNFIRFHKDEVRTFHLFTEDIYLAADFSSFIV